MTHFKVFHLLIFCVSLRKYFHRFLFFSVQQSLSDMYPPSLHPQSMAPPSQSVVPPSLRYPPPPPPPIMHPPPQIISHTTHDFMAAHQSRAAATGGFMSPRPPMLHPPGHAPRHAGNNYY